MVDVSSLSLGAEVPVPPRAIGRGRGRPIPNSMFPNANPTVSLPPPTNNNTVMKVAEWEDVEEMEEDDDNPAELIVQKEMVGRIIGRAGSRIKEIRENSGARIEIQDEGSESRVRFTGTPEEIKVAKQIIKDIVSQGGDARGFGDRRSDDRFREDRQREDAGNQQSTGVPSHWGVLKGVDEDEFGPPEVDDTPVDWAALRDNMESESKAKWNKLPAIVKDFYVEPESVLARTDAEVDEFRMANNNIQVKNFNEADTSALMRPVVRFEEAYSGYPEIMQTISKQGFERPSPIQCQMWPYLLSGRDVIGIAQTGTGKTLGFLLPAFIHIEGQTVPRGKRGGPSVLIFAPTRELAQQISNEVKKYEYRGIKSVCVYGGGSMNEQLKAIEKGVEIIIATPGRFNHFVEKGAINLETITYLVLDEADRMLDQGFEYEIRKTLCDIRPDRITVMTSATWPADVRKLATKYMVDPATVFVGSLDLATVKSVTQEIVQIKKEDKMARLVEFIHKMEPDDKVIVFAGRKSLVTEISVALSLAMIPCQSIHGDRDQEDREQALDDLRSGEIKILIATDVASRGIDIQDVTHVMNYDFPRDMEEYVHRIGRTGRAGKTGTSISFFTREDWRKSPDLVSMLEEAKQPVPDWLRIESKRFLDWMQNSNSRRNAFVS
jgi:ATP-dependent RNA helicase DDX43